MSTKIFLLFIIAVSFAGASKLQKRIFNGIQAKPKQFPYQVALAYSNFTEIPQFCSGAIIDDSLVLTAAHCMFIRGVILHPEDVYVMAGCTDLNSTSQIRYDVEKILVHENFSVSTIDANLPDDIALIKIFGNFSENSTKGHNPVVKALAIGDTDLDLQTICTVAGWGSEIHGSNSTSNTLSYTNLRIVNAFDCKRRYAQIGLFVRMDNIVCAEGEFSDACTGDSGSPLVCYGKDQTEYLIGIVSWGMDCASNYPGIYTKVSAYQTWVTRNSSQTPYPFLVLYILITFLVTYNL